MKDWPFKDNPDTLVVVCNNLLNGEKLHWVHHVPKEEYIWQFMSEEEHHPSNISKITLEKALKLFPEIIELGNTPEDMSVSYKWGKNSGNWYDFHHS